jgi:hypothetical protein
MRWQAFLARERPDMNPNTTFTVLSTDNGTDPQGPGDAGYAHTTFMKCNELLMGYIC